MKVCLSELVRTLNTTCLYGQTERRKKKTIFFQRPEKYTRIREGLEVSAKGKKNKTNKKDKQNKRTPIID